MIKFLFGLLLTLFGLFLLGQFVYAENNSVQALVLIPDDWTNRVDGQKILDYKTNILKGLKESQRLYSFSYSNDVKVNNQAIGVLDKTKLHSGDCLFNLVRSSLNLGFLNNLFGLSHKGTIYIFFVVGSGDVKNCYHEPELIFQILGGDKEIYINHETLETLGDNDQDAISIITQQLGQALSLTSPQSSSPTSNNNPIQTSKPTATPDPRVPSGKKTFDEPLDEGCRLKGGTRCLSTDKGRLNTSLFDDLCTNLGGVSLGQDAEGGCYYDPTLFHRACCKYVTVCESIGGQCASPSDKSNTKFLNEPTHSLVHGYCPTDLYDWSKSGDLLNLLCWNDPAKGTLPNFSSAAPISTVTPTNSPTLLPSPATSSQPSPSTSTPSVSPSVSLSPSISPSQNPPNSPPPSPTSSSEPTASPVVQAKKITGIRINNQDLPEPFNQTLSIRLPGNLGTEGKYEIPVIITYSDSTIKAFTLKFHYKPPAVVSSPSPSPVVSASPPASAAPVAETCGATYNNDPCTQSQVGQSKKNSCTTASGIPGQSVAICKQVGSIYCWHDAYFDPSAPKPASQFCYESKDASITNLTENKLSCSSPTCLRGAPTQRPSDGSWYCYEGERWVGNAICQTQPTTDLSQCDPQKVKCATGEIAMKGLSGAWVCANISTGQITGTVPTCSQ